MNPPVAGLLHTVPALATRFERMITAQRADLRVVHVVDSWLLATSRRVGVTDEVRAAVARHLAHLRAVGASAILVTCSSIGEAAEDAANTIELPVLRVDEPMAREAARFASVPGAHGMVAVLATLTSTLGPTSRLVERAARGLPVRVSAQVVAGAAEARDRGDDRRADALIADAVGEAAAVADVVVLAQASMAAAAQAVAVAVPVLTSPDGGVSALLEALDGR